MGIKFILTFLLQVDLNKQMDKIRFLLFLIFLTTPVLTIGHKHHAESLIFISHQAPDKVDVSDYKNITNLGAKNWVYGDYSTNKYEKVRFQYITANNVSNCPLERPFVFKGETSCANCPYDTPIFNLYDESCEPCEDDKVYERTTQLCVEKNAPVTLPEPEDTQDSRPVIDIAKFKNITNIAAKNWILGNISFLDYQLLRFKSQGTYNLTNCPLDQPFMIEGQKKCSDCPIDFPIFVLSNSTCVACVLPGQVWDRKKDACANKTQPPKPKPEKPVVNETDCEEEGYKDFPSIKLYQDFGECEGNQYYDYEKDKCTPCKKGQYFDEAKLACLYCDEETPFLNDQFECQQCPEDTEIDQELNKCV